MTRKWRAIITLLVILGVSAAASAFINPNFTPKNLYTQAEIIAVLEFKKPEAKATTVTGTITKITKGKYDRKEVVIELPTGPLEAQGRQVIDKIAAGNTLGMLFCGKFTEGGSGQATGTGEGEGGGGTSAADGTYKGFLSLGGRWIVINATAAGNWEMDKTEDHLLGTFAGSTDELKRVMEYLKVFANADQSDTSVDLPCTVGAEWAKEVKVGTIDGDVQAAAAVDVTGFGRSDLFVAAKSGDKLFHFNDQTKAFDDVTEKSKLKSSSAAFAWADFNGDGLLDLASWDGKVLTILSQKADGTFEGKPAGAIEALKGGCVNLCVVDAGRGKPALLAGTPKGAPVLLTVQTDGTVQGKAVFSGELPDLKELDDGGRCFGADFDGDAIPDILEVFTNAGLFYKGKALGEFAAPAPCDVATGRGVYCACMADFDEDGLPDLFISSAGDGNSMWRNMGGGRFRDMLKATGEVNYISKSDGIACDAGDFNNDGTIDIILLYGTPLTPQLFFNRGFLAFGHAREMSVDALESVGEGQRAGCLGDFNHDGALDMAIILKNGQVFVYPRKVEEKKPALSVLAAFSPNAATVGPITVRAYIEEQKVEVMISSWIVRAGEPGALIGIKKSQPITLKWKTADGKEQSHVVVVKGSPVRVQLDKAK